ncbi:T9SS type A sorting domain-containing protein [Aureisphaera galaxeae]|uniref:T9SS type A sorting domain-containing protein n=1 Tax=Aureisphaera galaxeae TaxID=1538023 RepID=UPI002350CD15|nr:T9SS type A sorting domain-containing protein [Aureisphaera galaxeae]MDC8005961.1 T9SS type A sorting domain-containing protein [Aureisphaera galaxeae]
MKKIILLISAMALSVSGLAQQELLDYEWTLHYMVINGDTIDVAQPHPSNPSYHPQIEFTESSIGFEVYAYISFNYFADALPPTPIDGTTIAIQGPSITLGDCDYCLLESQYFGTILYGDGAAPRIYEYEIVDGTDGNKTLIINTPEGNSAVHGNFILSTEEFDRSSIAIHPNPAGNVLNIDSNQWSVEKVQVFSLLGKSLFEEKVLNQNNTIDVSSLTSGIYFAQLTFENGRSYVHKFIKD